MFLCVLYTLKQTQLFTDKLGFTVLTSVQASGQQVPLASRTLKMWSRPVNELAGLSGLGLCPPTVSKL